MMVTWETLCTVQQREKLVPSSWISLFASSMRKTHGHCSYSVAVIQKSITFIDYVKGGQLPRMLHFVYRVPKVLQERGQTVSFVILKRITRAKRARDIFIESFHVYLLHTRNACSKKREFSVELFMYFHVCRLMSL